MAHPFFPCTPRVAATLLSFVATAPVAAQVAFPVQFAPSADVLTPDEKARLTTHFQEAGRRWSALIDSDGPRTVDIRIAVDDTIATANARSFTTAYVGERGGRELYEVGAAHELRTGIDINDASFDIEINISSIYLRNELWFDPDPTARTASVPNDRVDAMSVALHELGHAFGYSGWADVVDGSAPFDYWSLFDSFIVPGDAQFPPLFAGPHVVAEWGTAPDLTRNNIQHWGNTAAGKTLAPTRLPPPPPAWIDGSPQPTVWCEMPPARHAPPSRPFDLQAKVAPALIAQLMNGVVFYYGTRYDISALDRAMLRDLGLADMQLFASGFELGADASR